MILVCLGVEDRIRVVACVRGWDAAYAAARLLEIGMSQYSDPLWFTIDSPYFPEDEEFADQVARWHEQQPGYVQELIDQDGDPDAEPSF